MSQKSNEKPRRGRASTGPSQPTPVEAIIKPAPGPIQPAPLTHPASPPTATVGSQTEQDEVMETILKRLEQMDTKSNDDAMHRKEMTDHIATVTRYMEENRQEVLTFKRKLMITEQQLKVANVNNTKLEMQLNNMENQLRVCNIRIEGKRETEGEDLTQFLLDMARQVGASKFLPNDIISAARLGRKLHNERPRTILVTLVSRQARNSLYYARARLHNTERFRGIYINDDVTATTRRQRDEYRSVAAIARAQGAEIRIHDDGLIIDGTKYLLGESHRLPGKYSMEKARAVESGGEIYFASHYTFLSNFSHSPIVEGETVYPTAEHLYQARKCEQAQDDDRLRRVIEAVSPLEAKKVADEIKETPEWRGYKDGIMTDVINMKFEQNRELAQKLMDTGIMQLNEATHNMHFGIGVTINNRAIKDKSYRGENRLGKILMDKRDELNAMRNRVEAAEQQDDRSDVGGTNGITGDSDESLDDN